jgi:hypothetical protein
MLGDHRRRLTTRGLPRTCEAAHDCRVRLVRDAVRGHARRETEGRNGSCGPLPHGPMEAQGGLLPRAHHLPNMPLDALVEVLAPPRPRPWSFVCPPARAAGASRRLATAPQPWGEGWKSRGGRTRRSRGPGTGTSVDVAEVLADQRSSGNQRLTVAIGELAVPRGRHRHLVEAQLQRVAHSVNRCAREGRR